jgi:Endomembrane protein 70
MSNSHQFTISAAGQTLKNDDDKVLKTSYCAGKSESIKDDSSHERQKLDVGEIFFSYEVRFYKSDKAIGSRWDSYQFLKDEEIHWLSILNSFIITIVLTLIIAHILRRTLRKDLKEYNEVYIFYLGLRHLVENNGRHPRGKRLETTI